MAVRLTTRPSFDAIDAHPVTGLIGIEFRTGDQIGNVLAGTEGEGQPQ